MIERPPNMRVQRTRPLASLGGSPLPRHPLGGLEDASISRNRRSWVA